MIDSSTVNTKFQVTIPKKVRKSVTFLKPHTKVTVEEQNDVIIIRKEKKLEDFLGALSPSAQITNKTAKMSDEQLKKAIEKQKIKDYKKQYGKTR